MIYISTRGNAPAVSSAEALLNGIAPDGGLYVPAALPEIPSPDFWLDGDFSSTMKKLLALFFDDVPADIREAAVARASARFSIPETVALRSFDDVHFLELFHGPTLAFKDVALTLLPSLLQFAAAKAGMARAAVLTATSGDTGSAAMSGFADVSGTEALVFYPKTGTSEIQRRQMVCCLGKNVAACAIDGNFDDAQAGVKAAFADAKLRADAAAKGVFLSSANSINVGRLFPQVCYYLDAWRRLKKSGALAESGVFDVVVPTGNFGNILAANFAKKLGAPIRRLIAASNENRVVADFIATGTYDRRREFHITNSPSMDILVSSNVERLLYGICRENSAARVRTFMSALKTDGAFLLSPGEIIQLRENYSSGWATPEETETAIAEIYRVTDGYLADPHTAVAWKVLKDFGTARNGVPAVIAATASPWKFPATMMRALSGKCVDDDFENLRALAALTKTEPALANLETAPVLHTRTCAVDGVVAEIRNVFGL